MTKQNSIKSNIPDCSFWSYCFIYHHLLTTRPNIQYLISPSKSVFDTTIYRLYGGSSNVDFSCDKLLR